jgi:hypothetical protein
MPVDREKWAQDLQLSNFVNTFYQYRDLQQCSNAKKVLVIGPGQGLDTQVLKWRKYEVTTLDIDDTFKPDVVGSVHDLSMFNSSSFDVVIASHVLEHLAVPYLDPSLSEIARVGRHCLIYLPVSGRHFQLRLKFDVKGIDLTWILDLFNYFHRPDGLTARHCAGQHYWEVGRKGFRVGNLINRFEKHFAVIDHYRNRDWNSSYNFILRSRYSQ